MNKFSNLETLNVCFDKGITAKNIMPAYYIIEPTNVCNYQCVMCPNKDYQENQKGHMNMDLFKKIIDEIKNYAIFVQLYWMGEPFLYSNLFQMIDYISANSEAKIIISTNGSLLDSNLIDKIICSNIYKLIVSLDAAKSQSIYKQIRVGGNLEKVNKNVSLLLEKNSNLKIDLQFIDFNINKSEQEEFNKMWSGKNCRLTYSWLNTWANQFCELKNETYYDSPNSLIQRLPCSELWYKMCIHWNGNVSICCYDWNFKAIFGNLNESDVKVVWNSELINQYRNFHKNNQFEKVPLCTDCNEWATIEEYKDILE
jgi:Radical SAM superfamily.